MKAARFLAFLVVTALVGFLSFAVRRLGVNQGYVVGTYTSTVASAGLTRYALATEDRGDYEASHRMLDMTVDNALIEDWGYHELFTSPPFYAPREPYEVNVSKVLHLLAEYRESHPHDVPEPGASMVRATLARLGSERAGR